MMFILYAFIVIVFPTLNSLPSYPKKCEGEKYNLLTYECQHVECPFGSLGNYPNCTCSQKDFDADGNSTGDERVYKYVKLSNTCQKLECNGNTTGTYPNCLCIDENLAYNIDEHVCAHICNDDDDYNFDNCVHVCPKNSTGDWPVCNCGIDEEYDEDSETCKTIECPNEGSTGIYPFCTSIVEKRSYEIDLNGPYSACPENSTGNWPWCICDVGKEYDRDSESCKTIECPNDNSTGIYPNCTCIDEKLTYDNDLNRCIRVCPEDSSGYWPNCICDDVGSSFNKKVFECLACPSDSTGIYPNCECGKGISYIKHCNICEKCGENSVFINGSCECSDGYIYDIYENECVTESIFASSQNVQCPLDTHGIYPNCFCENNGTYDYMSHSCKSCDDHEQFSITLSKCVRCSESDTFIPTYGICVPEKKLCPSSSTGFHPYCTCENGKYDKDLRSCDHCAGNYSKKLDQCAICTNSYYDGRSGECILCPANSTGIHPKCKCETTEQVYNVYTKQCVERCDRFSYYVDARCGYGHYFDDNDSLCKSNVGRKCPIDSIGVGPDCLCIKNSDIFIDHVWNCVDRSIRPTTYRPHPVSSYDMLDAIVTAVFYVNDE